MMKKTVLFSAGSLLLLTGIVFFNNLYQNNVSLAEKPKKTEEVVVSKTEDELAKDKVKELNEKVINGEERVVSMSAMFPEVSKEEAFEEADIVIKGNVESIDKEYMENTDIPFTDFIFNVNEYLKKDLGDNAPERLIVTQDGNTTIKFNEHPLMEVGEEYILFLKRATDNNNQEKLILVGGPNGNFGLDNGVIKKEFDTQSVDGDTEIEFIEEASQGEITKPWYLIISDIRGYVYNIHYQLT